MVGFDTSDDAAVYRISDDIALLLTVDFFTPIVDDPYDFGRITAANALSDVYAMGGRPIAVLNLLAFPCKMDPQVIADVLRGGADTVVEAGAVTVGGHTIDDAEPKYGLSVLGTVAPDRVIRNIGAQPGDVLFLTKPIGTGLIATAIKRGIATETEARLVIDSMARLNRGASEAMIAVGVNAATDVTGFGLLGHLHEMAEGSGCAAEVIAANVPVFEGAFAYSEAGVKPGRTEDVVKFARPFTDFDRDADQGWWDVLCDPQTSGGLLISVAADRADELAEELERRGEMASRVGRMVSGEAGRVTVR
jgi:selenide, water dikinase